MPTFRAVRFELFPLETLAVSCVGVDTGGSDDEDTTVEELLLRTCAVVGSVLFCS